jgi:hypothetical protein
VVADAQRSGISEDHLFTLIFATVAALALHRGGG